MTQHSEFGGFITGDMLPESVDWPACNTALARYRINNAIHAYDEATQVRVHHIQVQGVQQSSEPSSGDPQPVWSFGYIPYLRADGSTAPLIIRVAGQRSAGSMTVYARLRPAADGVVNNAPYVAGRLPPLRTDDINVTSVAVTSGTRTWYTMPDTLSLSAGQVATAFKETAIFKFDNTTERVRVSIPLVALDIWVDGPGSPSWDLVGCYAREYIG